ncbi:hypothetical protein P3T76_009614 [Phytophthora citrophthora]|uniref:Uncharacterized protein n=1 Tax=Phytophthora citrophthora TaxID=4793 RepID=A0AAD9GGB4_9STRA|nr:hypothetical protein P3T76_009614 [Phytophthora citrophthora]
MEMKGFRKKRTKQLLPGQKMHQGIHNCICDDEDQAVHSCGARCPYCSYFCSKKYGHYGSHTTVHGNMHNAYLLSETVDTQVGEQKYKADELEIAEMSAPS